ncbi:glycosyltransferase [Alcanivorax sp.]|uniref:glycosyltransferase n=1 Tax=Alcanivorax sp. TaxID=1872427 RepID=UPI0025BA41BA|nr:glycosyltransferase [Alcanivorax sp.]
MRRKVFITVSSLDYGGVEVRTLESIAKMIEMNVDIDFLVCAVSGKEGQLDEKYRELGVDVVYAKGSMWIQRVINLYVVLKKQKPDVFHANASYASGIFAFVAFLAGIRRRVSHIRSLGFPEMASWRKCKYNFYLPMLNFFSNVVVGVASEAQKKAKTPDNKWQTLYDGIPFSDYVGNLKSKDKNQPLKLVVVGRFHECKNLTFPVDVANRLMQKSGRPVELIYIGQETPEIKLSIDKKAARCGMSNSVFYMGRLARNKTLKLISESDILLVTSIREGLPGTIIEAASCGVPSLGSSLPGVVEISSFISSVVALPLASGSQAWADKALDLVEAWDGQGIEIETMFRQSPFTVDRHVGKLLALWFD